MLQLTGPSSCISSPRKIFYDLFRVLEASRALLYNEETILSQECWLRFQKTLSSEKSQWDPMEEIITLMIHTSCFSLRANDLVEKIPEPERFTNPSVALLAAEGLVVQDQIYNWHSKTLLQLLKDDPDDYLNLALLYYHALLIFLSGNFDYFSYWDHIPAPIIDHLEAILDRSDDLLLHSKIPGVMLFFPVTVAGSRVRFDNQKSRVLDLLDRVFCKGFVVANRVRDGLLVRWAERDRREREFCSMG
ncbi:uncharacterized protein N7477_006435 [Penicillium maclennaniae]|uniref:uncharacterized protein n=1 Tax=Penicillium maclennaniae TaxID=1343394 RepID=UPI002540B2CC|nr:uncharacterized protein N7477_006435 [Penicillium maclennaniae]KAJ5667865.1 hypothetical protein N7477_006435 [Penicillium maclennaniae]